MVFQKSEWYLFILAAFTLALIYNQAAGNLGRTAFSGITSIFGKVMGQNSAGNFQKPF